MNALLINEYILPKDLVCVVRKSQSCVCALPSASSWDDNDQCKCRISQYWELIKLAININTCS